MSAATKLALIAAPLAVAAALVLPRYDLGRFGWGDALMVALLAALLWWCFSLRGNKSATHEDANKGIAFRLGKTLNSIRRGDRR